MSFEVEEIAIGEARDFPLQLQDENGQAYPVTGATITCQLKTRTNSGSTSTGAAVACGSGVAGAVFAAGTVIYPVLTAESATWTAGDYEIEMKITGLTVSPQYVRFPKIIRVVDAVQ